MAYNGKDIQEQLNKHGYNLALDGIVGPKTTAAIKEFQTANGLDPDGIVGPKTWAALTQSQTPTTTTTTPAQTEIKAPTVFDYAQSEGVKQSWANYDELKAQKPGEADKTWFDKLIDTWNQIDNREKFSYDMNGDALYQQYKDQHTTQGKLAMMDTMGQAAAMTGGYGNSYAQSVGQQAYQGYLQQLNDKVPELYKLALDQYNQEGQDLYNKAGLLYNLDESAYNRNQAEWDKYYKNLGLAFDEATYLSDTDYNQQLDKHKSEWEQTNFDYTKERNAVEDDHWQQTFDEGVRQFDADHSLQTYKAGVEVDKDGNYYTANPGWDVEKIKAFQEDHGLVVDGKWGPKTAAAYDADPNWFKKTPYTPVPYDNVVSTLNTMVGGGGNPNDKTAMETLGSDIKGVLKEALKNGVITQEEYHRLWSLYGPVGNAYN